MVQMPSPAGGPADGPPADTASTHFEQSHPASDVGAGAPLPASPAEHPEPAEPESPEEHPDVSTTGRLAAGIALGAVAAAFGGWILGEYPFTGIMPYITGVLFALVVTEIMLSISRRSGWDIGIAASLASIGGIGLAVWIQSTEGLIAVPVGGWVAIAIGGVVALLRGGLRMGAIKSLRRRAPPAARS
ncbi:MAG: hypothetical protein ACRDZ8_04715 [Acidimicrobiales bacterium]